MVPATATASRLAVELETAISKLQQEIENGPIVPTATPREIRSHLESRYDFRTAQPLEEVVADAERMLRTWHVQVTHPRYFGLFNPSVTIASVLADTLVAAYNPQLATARTSPAATEIERHTLAWLARKFGLPESSAATFTSGGAEANLSAVIAALTSFFPEYGDHGLNGARPVVYLTDAGHHSFQKIAHMTGIGRSALHFVRTGQGFRMDVDDLARRVAEDRNAGLNPFMVVATAGTTVAGAIDPLLQVAEFCHAEKLWFHVDAAWGGAAILSPRLCVHLKGIGSADSITCDAHKWFSVPMGAGMFFCRHPDAVRQAFRAEASYMPGKLDDTPDPYTSSVQWSRRFIGLKLFLSLAHSGEAAYAEQIEHQAQMGNLLRERLRDLGWTIVNDSPLPLVCFTRDGLVPAVFLRELYKRQIAWMSEAQLGGDGTPVLRACITSFRTKESHIERVLGEMTRLWSELQKGCVDQ